MNILSHFYNHSTNSKVIIITPGLSEATKVTALISMKYLPGTERLHSFSELIH